MIFTFFVLLVGFQLKHFIADYLLQPRWMVQGKGSFAALGGYAHAAIHAACSAIVLLVVSVPVGLILGLCAAEFVIHYFLDFAKIHYTSGIEERREPARYWGLFGFDQLLHQLTYVVMVYSAFSSVSKVLS
ncbi:MAG: DUF3307 domain-containing protein [Cucumibacter sp.]